MQSGPKADLGEKCANVRLGMWVGGTPPGDRTKEIGYRAPASPTRECRAVRAGSYSREVGRSGELAENVKDAPRQPAMARRHHRHLRRAAP